jgi:hypothetical protein
LTPVISELNIRHDPTLLQSSRPKYPNLFPGDSF